MAFLRYEGSPLSAKATSGFLRRTEIAKLRFPPGFIQALKEHLQKMPLRQRIISTSADDAERFAA
jgi:hypothetical protein